MNPIKVSWLGRTGTIRGKDYFNNFRPDLKFITPSGEERNFQCVGLRAFSDLVYVSHGRPSGDALYVYVIRE